jgi:hypothetical protein
MADGIQLRAEFFPGAREHSERSLIFQPHVVGPALRLASGTLELFWNHVCGLRTFWTVAFFKLNILAFF